MLQTARNAGIFPSVELSHYLAAGASAGTSSYRKGGGWIEPRSRRLHTHFR